MGGRLLHYLVVELEWDSVPEAASYQVGVWVSGSAEYTALPAGGVSVDMDGSGARAVVRGLPDENYYYFTVRARNAFGTSDWSDFVFLNTDQGWPETPDPTPAPEPTPEPEVVPPVVDEPEPEVVPPDPDPPEPEVVPPVVDEPEPEVVPPDPDLSAPEVVPPDPDLSAPEVVPTVVDEPAPEVVPPDPDPSAPSVALVLSSVRSAPGAEIGVTMSFAGLELDSDAGTVDYVFRADVLGADVCEDRAGGYGLGVDRRMHKVDEDPEVRTGTVGADCPVGDYTLEATLAPADGVQVLASVREQFSVVSQAPLTASVASDTAGPVSSAFLVTVSFSRAVSGFTEEDVRVSNGSVVPGSVASEDSTVFSVSIVPDAGYEGLLTVDVAAGAATDGSGLPNTAAEQFSVAVQAEGDSDAAPPSAAPPSAAVGLSLPGSVQEGTEFTLTMSFAGLEHDSDAATVDYVFRADVLGADVLGADVLGVDVCEDRAGGYGLGVDRRMHKVDEDPEVRTGTVSADCPVGDYTVEAIIYSAAAVRLGAAVAGFSVVAPPAPSAALALSAESVEQGAALDVTVTFSHLPVDADPSTVDYVFRVDVMGADECEGEGLGVDRDIKEVDESAEVYTGAISTGCPVGDYVVTAGVSSPAGVGLAADTAELSVVAGEAAEPPTPPTTIIVDDANDHPNSIWSDGTTMWVIGKKANAGSNEADARRIFAYNLADGSRDASKEINLYYANYRPSGVWSDGTTMWVADSSWDRLYAYNMASGSRDVSREFKLHSDNGHPTGLWSDGTTIWVADSRDRKLYAYTDGSRDASKEFDLHSENANPRGIWSDGTTIWVVDLADTKLYAYNLADGRHLGSSADGGDFWLDRARNAYPRGAWSDGTTIWVADGFYDSLQPYELRQQNAAPADITLTHDIGYDYWRGARVAPKSLWTDGTTLWVADTATWKLYAYNLADGSRDESKEFELFCKPRGLWSDGTTIWVAAYDRLLAYNLADGSRDESKEFGLHGDNGHTVGIWSDGTTIWAVDLQDRKLYAYNLADGSRDQSKEFNLLGDHWKVHGGLWSDGTTIWISDEKRWRLRAYALSDGAPVPSSDVGLVWGNGEVEGITSDGTTIWVSEFLHRTVYAYPVP